MLRYDAAIVIVLLLLCNCFSGRYYENNSFNLFVCSSARHFVETETSIQTQHSRNPSTDVIYFTQV